MTSVCRSQCCRCCWCCCPRGCCVQTANIANIATTAITTISQDLSDLSPGLPVSHSALSAASLHPTSDNQSPTPRMTPALGHQATGKQNSAAWVAQTRSQDGANKEHMAKYRERGLGHLLSLFRGTACQCQALAATSVAREYSLSSSCLITISQLTAALM